MQAGRGRWLEKPVSEEARSPSLHGFKEQGKGFNWILNCLSSQAGFGMHNGLYRAPC